MVADDPLELVRLLADEPRLRVFCAVVLGARRSSAVAEQAGLPAREALKALSRLERAGLVERRQDGWVARPARLREIAVAHAPTDAGDDADQADPATVVLRAFMQRGRLLRIPTQHTKRLVVLDHVARMFEPGLRYSETDVNARLAEIYEDTAALRRYLVDEGFLTREYGMYWRIGGTVVV